MTTVWDFNTWFMPFRVNFVKFGRKIKIIMIYRISFSFSICMTMTFMYKSTQLNVLFCSVLIQWQFLHEVRQIPDTVQSWANTDQWTCLSLIPFNLHTVLNTINHLDNLLNIPYFTYLNLLPITLKRHNHVHTLKFK